MMFAMKMASIATDLQFNLRDPQFGLNSVTNVPVQLQAQNIQQSGAVTLLPWKLTQYTDTNGVTTFTNVYGSSVAGFYHWVITVPNTSKRVDGNVWIQSTNLGTVSASSVDLVVGAPTYPAGTWSWSAYASDIRYAGGSNLLSSYVTIGQLNNASNVLQLQIFASTNGFLPIATNIAYWVYSNNPAGYLSQIPVAATNQFLTAVPIAATNKFILGLTATNSFDPTNSAATVLASILSSNYVTAAVTNGLATTNWANGKFYPTSNPSLFVDRSITNGFATIAFVQSATNGFVDATITNGVIFNNRLVSASNSIVALIPSTNGFVTASITNGLATTNYAASLVQATNGFVTAAITNGLATTNYVLAQGFLQTVPVASTNKFVTTNDTTWFISQANQVALTNGYLRLVPTAATNQFVTTNDTTWFISQANQIALTNGYLRQVPIGATNQFALTNAQWPVSAITNGNWITNSQSYALLSSLIFTNNVFPNAVSPYAKYDFLVDYSVNVPSDLTTNYPNAKFVFNSFNASSGGFDYIQSVFGFVPDYYSLFPNIDKFFNFDYDPSGVAPNQIRTFQKIKMVSANIDLNGNSITNGYFTGDGYSITNLQFTNLSYASLDMVTNLAVGIPKLKGFGTNTTLNFSTNYYPIINNGYSYYATNIGSTISNAVFVSATNFIVLTNGNASGLIKFPNGDTIGEYSSVALSAGDTGISMGISNGVPLYESYSFLAGGFNDVAATSAHRLTGCSILGVNNTIGTAFDTAFIYHGEYSTIAGGYNNLTYGAYSFIAGGTQNIITANGSYSTVAGYNAASQNLGCFVWNSWPESQLATTGTNQFLIGAIGGVGIKTNNPAGYALNVAGIANAFDWYKRGVGVLTSNSIISAHIATNLVSGVNITNATLVNPSIQSAITTNIAVIFGNGSTNTLYFTNGILYRITP